MGPGGFAQTGGRTAPTPPGTTPFAFAPEATAYNETTDKFKDLFKRSTKKNNLCW